MRFFRDADFQFIEKRRPAYVVSATAILLGIGAMLFFQFSQGSWLRYGVDFTGGSMIQVEFDVPATAEEIRQALGGGREAPPVTRFGDVNEFVVRVPLEAEGTVEEAANRIQAQLEESYGAGSFRVVRTETVGPKVGAELQRKAAFAILFSFFLTLIYLAIRFELRFGVAAVIATVHDILITLGFLALFRIEISLPTVAAILTIVGYSLNDTIVVFDRIRENLGKKGARKADPYVLVNRSINEVLPRTVLTSGTTLAVLLALLFLGGVVIRDFTVVLILGVVIGTYSSMFTASPALLEIEERWGTAEDRRRRRRASSPPARV